MQSFINRINNKKDEHDEDGLFVAFKEGSNGNDDSVALPSPDNIAKIEPLMFWNIFRSRAVPPFAIRFGVSFDALVTSSASSFTRVQQLISDYYNEQYVITTTSNKKQKEILVCLKTNASQISKAKAYFHAWILGHYL